MVLRPSQGCTHVNTAACGSGSPDDRSFNFAESDAVSVSLTEAGDDEGIAILEESAARGSDFERLSTTPAQLQQTTALVLLGSADRTRPHEVADAKRTARRGMVNELLDR